MHLKLSCSIGIELIDGTVKMVEIGSIQNDPSCHAPMGFEPGLAELKLFQFHAISIFKFARALSSLLQL